jgi:hypothetical protein
MHSAFASRFGGKFFMVSKKNQKFYCKMTEKNAKNRIATKLPFVKP